MEAFRKGLLRNTKTCNDYIDIAQHVTTSHTKSRVRKELCLNTGGWDSND